MLRSPVLSKMLLVVVALAQGVPSVLWAENAQPLSNFSAAVQARLRKDKFIRNLSCQRFADLVLGAAGLPRLGEDSPARGTRGDLNRTRQNEEPPILEDSEIESQHPYSEYRVRAYGHPTDRQIWYLELTRDREIIHGHRTQLVTRFGFRLGVAANRPSCDLMEIRFQEPSGKLAGNYDSDRCLTLFDPSATVPGPGSWNLAMLRKDCALGLRYFLAMKWPR